jgi:hypothetical protein
LGTITDAKNAIGRLEECFTAELVSDALVPDLKLKHAVEIDNASFTWDGPHRTSRTRKTREKIKDIVTTPLRQHPYPNRKKSKKYCLT